MGINSTLQWSLDTAVNNLSSVNIFSMVGDAADVDPEAPYNFNFKTLITALFTGNERIAHIGNTEEFLLYVNYTKGSETSIQIHAEVSSSPDEDDFFEITGVIDLSLSANTKLREIYQVSLSEKFVKVQAKVTGAPNATTALILTYGTNNNRTIQQFLPAVEGSLIP